MKTMSVDIESSPLFAEWHRTVRPRHLIDALAGIELTIEDGAPMARWERNEASQCIRSLCVAGVITIPQAHAIHKELDAARSA